MQVMLAENIRAFRREKKLTQEQLAEVLGVTVGTVSKWESAASTPDVGLIMEMADFSAPRWTCCWATGSRAPVWPIRWRICARCATTGATPRVAARPRRRSGASQQF